MIAADWLHRRHVAGTSKEKQALLIDRRGHDDPRAMRRDVQASEKPAAVSSREKRESPRFALPGAFARDALGSTPYIDATRTRLEPPGDQLDRPRLRHH